MLLVCLAWVLSCFDAVSYFHAGEQQHLAEHRLQGATAAATSTGLLAGEDAEHVRERLERDQVAVAGDQLAVARAEHAGLDDGQEKQTLAADQAALQADRMMQYTVENFARQEPNPEVVAAADRVDVDRRLLAQLGVTRTRDRELSHFLIALWVLAAGTALLAFRGIRGKELAAETREDDEGEVENDLVAADEVDG